jgi:hypothetical protein
MASQLGDRFVDGGRAGFAQLLLGKASGDDRHRPDSGFARGFDVPRGVADHDSVVSPRLLERCADQVWLGLGRLDVVIRRPRIGQLTGVQEIEVVADLLFG